MTVPSLNLHSSGDPGLPGLVLVPGWGHPAAIWQPLLPALEAHFHVHLLDLPGYGMSEPAPHDVARVWQEAALMAAFERLPVGPAFWCGWSLGGMLASCYARYRPERVLGLMCVASNPVFVQRPDWPSAMTPSDYSAFAEALATHPEVMLARFQSLVCQGSDTARADQRQLKQLVGQSVPPAAATLRAGLELLDRLDSRQALADLSMAQRHVLGERDALVPAGAGDLIRRLNPRACVRKISGAGHAPLVSHVPTLAAELLALKAQR